MAKKQEVNKTEKIRDYLKKNPKATPTEVAAALKKQKVVVKAQYVSTVKSKMGAKKKSKVAKKTTSKKNVSSDKISLGGLVKAKKLADELGGVDKAKEMLDALAKLK